MQLPTKRSCKKQCTVYIPYTEEAKENNNKVISDIKTAAKSSSSNFNEINGYITFTSTLNYNRSYYNGSYDYVLVKLISFKLEREIHTSAPFDGFRRATALVSQVGTIGDPGNPAILNNQLKTYSNISYGTLYVAPSEWLAVLSDYVEGFKGVKYSIPIIYANGTTSTCTYIHSMR